MKNIKRAVAAALIGIFAFGAAGCNMITKTEAGKAKSKVATFDNQKITKAQLDEKMIPVINSLKEQYGENYATNEEAKQILKEQKKSMAESMVVEAILLQKAKDMKVVPDEKTLEDLTNKKLDEIKKLYDEETVKKAGYTQGYADPKFKEYAQNSVIMDKLYEEVVKNEKVEDKEAEDYYNANKFQYTEKPNQIHVAHILSDTEDAAKKVRERLVNGEDFAKVAKEVSTEPAAKTTGGDLGTVPYVGSGFDKTFMDAAIALKEGELSQPVHTQFGWHIIKTIKKEEYPVKSFDTVKEEIKKQLLEEKKGTKFQTEMEKWKTDANIKYYEENM